MDFDLDFVGRTSTKIAVGYGIHMIDLLIVNTNYCMVCTVQFGLPKF